MEILAPAGSIPMLSTAVAHGADAVYLGLDHFSARAKSTDFTTHNLALYVAYCHKYGVKVYVTLNTLVKSSELEAAIAVAVSVYEAGADAVLVQDLGLASLLKKLIPGLCLHASTQLGVHNVDGASFARDFGFRRIVLARETPLTEIAKIAKLGIETEVFAHGALCVSLSGNCYYSSLVSGMSGNRGRCLQLCRKEYRAECASCTKRGYLLSPADLCLLDRVRELETMGVTSLKIEGRLKRPEYAGAVVDVYRKALCGQPITRADRESLATVFSRGGFTEGYFGGETSAKDFVGTGVAGHLGLEIGSVTAVNPNSVEIVSKRDFDPDDGFKLVRGDREIGGASHAKLLGANRWRLSKIGDARIGDRVYLTTDAAKLRDIAALARKIPLNFAIRLVAGEPARVTVRDGSKRAEIFGEPPDYAQTAPLTQEHIADAFRKLGGTDYAAANVEVETESAFLPKAKLNELRRAAVDAVERAYLCDRRAPEIRLDGLRRRFEPVNPHRLYIRTDDLSRDFSGIAGEFSIGSQASQTERPQFAESVRCENIRPSVVKTEEKRRYTTKREALTMPSEYVSDDAGSQAQFTFNRSDPKGFARVYAPSDYRDLCAPKNAETYLDIPAIAFDADIRLLEAQINVIRQYCGIVANNVWGLEFARRHGLRAIGGFSLNLVNFCFDFAFDDVFFSPENRFENDAVAFGYGAFPLMTFAHCPYRAVTGKGCADCRYDGSLTYCDERGKSLSIGRIKLKRCYFTLDDVLELPAESRFGRVYVNAVGQSDEAIEAFLRGEKVLPRNNYLERTE